MRRQEFAMDRARALGLLARSEVVRLATTTPEGEPVLRTLNSVVVDDWLLFHGARAGEKARALGRSVVVAADEIVASIPSYFVDPERACPATSLFESVQLHGTLENVDDPALKARMLSALMEKYQPEGGYVPIAADAPLYERAVRGVLVFGVRLEHVTGKAKLGQNRSAAELAVMVDRLWARGGARDPRAIQKIFEANPTLERRPPFAGPQGIRLEPALDARDLESVLALVAGEYWNRALPRETVARAHLSAQAWVGARTSAGELVASARAVSDGAKHAYIADVIVAERYRGRGVGSAVVTLLLDHPCVRRAFLVRLGTADAEGFYARLGFVEAASLDLGFRAKSLVLKRNLAAAE
jgi:nitroimidazol reductase NimA-like FMN-containing flavoprotein (pyridoxamine 5'-phosphate oxidase superfamily)/ribosomal protein S18 acetylase RimI-like enzyme